MNKARWYQGTIWTGMDLFGWMRLLASNRFEVDITCLPAALVVTCFAAMNTTLRWLQQASLGPRIERVRLPEDPVFIIGHWRTGTTVLHELLQLDPQNRCPTTYECLSPNHFLLSERFVRRWLWFMLPRKRPMDNVQVGFDRPQEDEAALCNLGLPSPFLTVAFPNRPPQSPAYIDLEGLSPREAAQWRNTMLRFLKEITYRRSGRIVLKSPQHTFRLRALTEMFPRARFVHMVRDPYVIFPSTLHFWKQMYAAHGLQQPRHAGLEQYVFDTFDAMHRKLQATRHLVDSARFYELRYEDLISDPVDQMQALYKHLELGDFDAVRPAVQQYANRARRYQTNTYQLGDETRSKITRHWKPYIEKYGYASQPALARPGLPTAT